MLRRLLLISLIFLTPMHALAALQMPFDHQVESTIIQATDVAQHPCHQDMTNISSDEDPLPAQTKACNACTLCMAFGLFPLHLAMMTDHFSMIFNASTRISFISHDSLGLNKPPIL